MCRLRFQQTIIILLASILCWRLRAKASNPFKPTISTYIEYFAFETVCMSACQLYWSRGTGTYYIQLHLLHWYSAQTHRVHVIYRFIIGHHILFTQFIVLYRLVYMAFIQSAATLAAISNMNVWLYDMIVYTLTKMPFTLSVLETA